MIDIHSKRDEFTSWLNEIKKIDIEKITHISEKKYFEEFMEDYNTATMPSKKYYDIKKWEHKQLKKNKNFFNNHSNIILNDEAQIL